MKVTTMVLAALFVVVFGAGWLTVTGALAQGKGACGGDIEKFCQGVQQGEGRIAQCLAQHKEEVSPACKARMEEAAKQLKGVQKTCEDDIMAFCEGVKPGGGRIAQCLKANASKLSPQCKASVAQAKRGMR
ncbi:MAG TPA: cysteine rich repeat-containing protein [Syntrophorhabdales bacterium]|nr:cysteine rich repeat-containing protein [Syntrophorhabdales bacterium]